MKANVVRYAVLFCLIIASWFSYFHRWQGNDGYGWEATVDGDAKGYYAFLPAYYIYGDPSFTFYKLPGNESITRYYNDRFRVKTSSGQVNKNYAGTAMLIGPFFVMGHLLAKVSGEPLTGYSWPYMFILIVGALFYFGLGLLAVASLLRSYNLSEYAIAFTILLVGAGTNLLYYTSIHAAMPHVYSFFLIAVFALLWRRYFIYPQNKLLLLSGFVFGLIVLVRPVNGIALFALPFLAPSPARLQSFFFEINTRLKVIAGSLLLFFGVLFIQLLLYKTQTGTWWVWSYGDEGFRFNDPHIVDVLFSFKKGLLVYTPVMLLSFAGIGLLFRRSNYSGITWLIFICCITYIISSWWSWFYGDGFGLRAYIDFFPLMAVPLAFSGEWIIVRSKIIRSLLLFLCLLFLLLNLVQTFQYRYRIIHPVEMNFEKYRFIFLKTGAAYRDIIGGDNEYIYPELSKEPVAVWFNNFENTPVNWSGAKAIASVHAFSGTMTDLYNHEREWGTNLTLQVADLPFPSAQLFAVVSYRRLQTEPGACNKLYLACAVDDSTGKNISWKGFRANEYPVADTTRWMYTEARFRLPEHLQQGERLNFYFWNQEKTRFEVDDIRVELFKIE